MTFYGYSAPNNEALTLWLIMLVHPRVKLAFYASDVEIYEKAVQFSYAA
jgi:hypothetical protein